MKNLNLCALAIAAATLLSACGGGGGGATGNNAASISGTSTGSTFKGAASTVTGSLSITDPDAGQAVFSTPASLTGTYGTFSFNAGTGTWTYLIDNTKSATQALTSGQVAYDSLTVTSSDGTATQEIKITVSGDTSGGSGSGIALITSVPAPVYPSSDAFAAEKIAVFNRLNDDRARCGFGKVAQNALLDKAAQAHADYIAINKLAPTHFQTQGQAGFVGVDPAARLSAFGYNSRWFSDEILNQQLWGTFFNGTLYGQDEKSSTNNLRNLYASVYHLIGAMGPVVDIGIGISKITQNAGSTAFAKTLNIDFGIPKSIPALGQQIDGTSLATYPCEGILGVNPVFVSEEPNPFPSVNLDVTPYGQPVYLMSANGTALTLNSGSITLRGGAGVPVTNFNKNNDPNKRLTSNQVFLVPTQRLADNSTYDVVLTGTNTGMVSATNPTGFFSRTFSFTTGTFTSE